MTKILKTKPQSNAKDQMDKIRAFMFTPEAQVVRREEEAKIMLDYLIFRIKEIRKAKNLTQKQVAEIMGVNQPEIARWESGLTTPSLPALLNFCSAVNGRLELIY
jgi:DNA-binding transcriptional regulator YiaG